jgi:hypothetical protein
MKDSRLRESMKYPFVLNTVYKGVIPKRRPGLEKALKYALLQEMNGADLAVYLPERFDRDCNLSIDL